jgi:MFS family permease
MATFPLLAAVMALYGIGYGILFPSISALVADHTIPEERGMATGMFHALLTAGVATGAPIIGWVGGMVGVELGLVLSASILVLALIIALSALRRI